MDSTMVAVTPEARKAAADLLDEVSSLLGDTGIGQVADLIRDGEYDEHDATLAFARFERDILARSRSEVGCTVPADHPLAKSLRTSQKALDEIKRQEQANIAGYLAMRDMPIGSVAAEARHRISALTSDGGREALREALAEAYRKGATDVHNYWVSNPGEPPQGDPEFGEAASDYAHFAIELAALAQPVEAGEDGA